MAELIWEGKYDADGKLNAPLRVALPFQTVETVNESAQQRQKSLFAPAPAQAEWRNRLIWGDKKYVLPSLLPEFAGKVDLIYIDPPFNVGADFSLPAEVGDKKFTKQPSVIEQKAYRDTWGRGLDSYLHWFYEAAVLLRELMSEAGSIYIHLDWHVVHYAKSILDEVFGYDHFQREIIWRIGWISGYKSAAPNWIRNHDTILFYVNSNEFTFNKEYIPYPPDYTRRDGSPPSGKGYPIEDVWNASEMDKMDSIQIMSFSGEKVGYPTQKNENLLERIIQASSNEGDLVLDCFCGSGTTAAVAEKLNRRWITCDLGRFAIHTARKRLLEIENVQPFVVQNLGKYERQAWQQAEFGDRAAATIRAYRRFLLDLYHAEPVEGYTWLHGKKGGRMVHVGTVDSPVAPNDVQQIAIEFRKSIGRGENAPTVAGADVLGWDFALDMNETARQIAADAGLDVRFIRIPREVLEPKAVEQGDIRFFELAALGLDVQQKGRRVTVKLTDFMVPPDDVPEDVQQAVSHWSEWIDYWAADFNFRDDTFHNEWQSYRTRKERKLDLQHAHDYAEPGTYTVVVKVIDILGNDTTKAVQVEVA